MVINAGESSTSQQMIMTQAQQAALESPGNPGFVYTKAVHHSTQSQPNNTQQQQQKSLSRLGSKKRLAAGGRKAGEL